MDHPNSRSDARQAGLKHYRGGTCKAGHADALRYVHNKACVLCAKGYDAQRKADNAGQEAMRKRAWKEANRERWREEKRRYGANHREAIRARNEVYKQADPHGTIAAAKALNRLAVAWRKHEREERREQLRVTRQAAWDAHADARAQHEREVYAMRHAASMLRSATGEAFSLAMLRARVKRGKNRAKKFGCVADLRAWQLDQIGNWQGWACTYCGSNADLEIDHIHPLSRGGHHTASNVQWLCAFHNADKADIPDADYRRLRGIPLCTPWDLF